MSARVHTLDDLDLSTLDGVRVLVRVDFNVPLENGEVADDTRLREALPTLRELIGAGARLLLASHCGRPKGAPDSRYSLRPVVQRLADLLETSVQFAEDCVGEPAEELAKNLAPGAVGLLENLRFHPGETENDPAFAGRLASLAEAYVNDAFGTAHRAHASVVGAAERFERRFAGRLMMCELKALGRLLDSPRTPFAAILGGAKIGGKIDTLENLLPRLDLLIIGGGMANTFLAAQGHDMARSLLEPDRIELAREILERAEAANTRVVLPEDLVVTDDLDSPRRVETVAVDSVPAGTMAVDIGPESRRSFALAIAGAGTVFWNGPQGVFEKPPFDKGTVAVAEALAACSGYKVIGGGETVAAAERAGVIDRIDHVSTGGGASLELLAGKVLPGVAVLERAAASGGEGRQ